MAESDKDFLLPHLAFCSKFHIFLVRKFEFLSSPPANVFKQSGRPSPYHWRFSHVFIRATRFFRQIGLKRKSCQRAFPIQVYAKPLETLFWADICIYVAQSEIYILTTNHEALRFAPTWRCRNSKIFLFNIPSYFYTNISDRHP